VPSCCRREELQVTEQAGVGIAILGTIGIGATAETFEDARPMALRSCALLVLYGAGFGMLELAMRRASALAAKSQPSQLQVSAKRQRSVFYVQTPAHKRRGQAPPLPNPHAHLTGDFVGCFGYIPCAYRAQPPMRASLVRLYMM